MLIGNGSPIYVAFVIHIWRERFCSISLDLSIFEFETVCRLLTGLEFWFWYQCSSLYYTAKLVHEDDTVFCFSCGVL